MQVLLVVSSGSLVKALPVISRQLHNLSLGLGAISGPSGHHAHLCIR